MHPGRVSRRLSEAVPSQADVILYFINSVVQDEPPLEKSWTVVPRARAVKSPTHEGR